jgi:hypothetical protein
MKPTPEQERRLAIVCVASSVLILGLIVGLLAWPKKQGTTGDPLLPPGSVAVVAGDHGWPLLNERGEMDPVRLLAPGVRVRVGHDPGEGPAAPVVRNVSVTVESGENQGQPGKVDRSALRPVTSP